MEFKKGKIIGIEDLGKYNIENLLESKAEGNILFGSYRDAIKSLKLLLHFFPDNEYGLTQSKKLQMYQNRKH